MYLNERFIKFDAALKGLTVTLDVFKYSLLGSLEIDGSPINSNIRCI